MYKPDAFREERLDVLHGLIEAHPFGTLVTSDASGLIANHVPFLLHSDGAPALLHCHLARANAQWRCLDPAREVLVIFQAGDAYVTPYWYATRTGPAELVPTWDYAVVHVYGHPRVIEDVDWLRTHVVELTAAHESVRDDPWRVTDAPRAFIESQLREIVGVEISITRIEGKRKLGQDRDAHGRRAVCPAMQVTIDESHSASIHNTSDQSSH
ncbi:MAG: FMN-binding negative transcriptional regulator [Chloroflexota bacterium]